MIKQYYPQPGWVEHDAVQIFEDQHETVVVWNKTIGEPIHKAICWSRLFWLE